MFWALLILLTITTGLTGMVWLTDINSRARLVVFGVSVLLLTVLLFSRI